MEPMTTPIRDSRSGPGTPSPAGSAATEDEGQRYMENKSASELSDKYPAGLHPGPVCDSPNPSGSETRSVSLDIRLGIRERQAIRDRARVLGVKPSAWGRAVMLDALDARRDHVARLHKLASVTPQPDVVAAIEQLRRVGVNLNQTLRNGLVVEEGLLHEVMSALDGLRAVFGDRTSA